MLTQSYARSLFNYDAASGVLIWRVSLSNRAPIGSIAGSNSTNARIVRINKKQYIEAHIIWLWMTGTMPIEVDHKDVNPFNNRWVNLREATRSQNNANRRNTRPGKLRWTHYRVDRGYWSAQVKCKGINYYVGSFDTEQQAHDAAYALAQQLHGKFVRR